MMARCGAFGGPCAGDPDRGVLRWSPGRAVVVPEEDGGRVTADPATVEGIAQLAAQVTAGTELVPFQLPMKPKLVLAPAPSRPL